MGPGDWNHGTEREVVTAEDGHGRGTGKGRLRMKGKEIPGTDGTQEAISRENEQSCNWQNMRALLLLPTRTGWKDGEESTYHDR